VENKRNGNEIKSEWETWLVFSSSGCGGINVGGGRAVVSTPPGRAAPNPTRQGRYHQPAHFPIEEEAQK